MTDVLSGQDVGAFEVSPGARSAPGTNVKGAAGGANWCFLLPSLELGRIVWLGRPSPAALATLSRLGDEVAVCAPARHLRRIRRALGAPGPVNVSLVETDRHGTVPLPDASADVVVVARTPLLGGRGLAREAERLVKPEGVAYHEHRFHPNRLPPAGGTARTRAQARTAVPLWLAPAGGEVRAAAPLGDSRAIAFLERGFLARRLLRGELLRRPGRVLGRHRLVSRAVPRRGALVGRAAGRVSAGPPEYVSSLAAAAGVGIAGRRWALVARGEYPSQKVLFFLFEPEGAKPDVVVKITRDARFNARLENEWRALALLREHGLGTDGTLPQPLFFGPHAGLAVLGESAIDGVPFRTRTLATAECPYAGSAVEWLLELASVTASTASAEARVTSGLQPLLEHFARTYRLEPGEASFLGAHVQSLTRDADVLPLVFQHGDPGPWNVVVTADGRPVFLDWEAAEPRGMPLWDLFHFLRSYSLAVSRAAGRPRALRSFAEHWLEGSTCTRLILDATSRFCAVTGLPPRLVEPLFYVCWMHRALKEAATRPAHELAGGRYINILRLAIARHDSPVLRRLFSVVGA